MAASTKAMKNKPLLIALAATLVVVGGIYAMTPVRIYMTQKRVAVESRQRLERVARWHEEILASREGEKALIEQARAGSAQGDLWTVVNRAMQELNLQDRANLNTTGTASPSVAELEVSVTGVSLQELVDLLYKVYSSNALITVRDLRELGPSKQGKGLTCRMTLIAPKV